MSNILEIEGFQLVDGKRVKILNGKGVWVEYGLSGILIHPRGIPFFQQGFRILKNLEDFHPETIGRELELLGIVSAGIVCADGLQVIKRMVPPQELGLEHLKFGVLVNKPDNPIALCVEGGQAEIIGRLPLYISSGGSPSKRILYHLPKK